MYSAKKIFGLATFAGLMALAPLHADQWDKKTIITINAPVQIPTTTLQPGTYTLKLLDSLSNRHIVTVWDRDGMHHITTVLAIPNYRLQPTGDSKFSFWETPAGEAKALRAWFYPGDNFGQEFAYPKNKATQLAAYNNHANVPVLSTRDEEFTSKETTHAAVEPTPEPTPEPVAAEPTPAPAEPAPVAVEPEPAPVEPAPAPAPVEPEPQATTPAPEPAAQQPVDTMPRTASNWVEVLAIGLLAALMGAATFRRGHSV
jgi:hypothetical protein